jgi:pimeloyl-ACP methyl ester carboxylesterase
MVKLAGGSYTGNEARCLMEGNPVARRSSIFGTIENETKLMSIYDERLSRWPVPYECIYVPTPFGDTHVIVSGPEDAPPLVLIHALGVNATMWLPNVLDLSRHFRIYAIDTIGDLGKSRLDQFEKYPKNGQEYSHWLEDVFEKLNIQEAVVIGSSMGGWIAINFAINAAHRVNRLVLLAPQGLSANLEIIFRLFSVIFFPTELNKKSLVRWTLGENKLANDAFAEYLYTVMALNCRGNIATPVKLSKEKLGKVLTPTLLFVGKKDPTFNSQKDIDRAMKAIPNIQVEVMPDSGHMMSTESPEFVNNRILTFTGFR